MKNCNPIVAQVMWYHISTIPSHITNNLLSRLTEVSVWWWNSTLKNTCLNTLRAILGHNHFHEDQQTSLCASWHILAPIENTTSEQTRVMWLCSIMFSHTDPQTHWVLYTVVKRMTAFDIRYFSTFNFKPYFLWISSVPKQCFEEKKISFEVTQVNTLEYGHFKVSPTSLCQYSEFINKMYWLDKPRNCFMTTTKKLPKITILTNNITYMQMSQWDFWLKMIKRVTYCIISLSLSLSPTLSSPSFPKAS